jgi:predicted permease
MPGEQNKILTYATFISNAALLGNPIIESIYGYSGLTYASIYLLPLRIAIWTMGLAMFTNNSKGNLKTLLHPCLIATYLGIFTMFVGWIPPNLISKIVLNLGTCMTPLSMIVIGHILSQMNLKNMMTKTIIYYTSIRLIIIPVFLLVFLKNLNVNPLIIGISVILSGMPAPITISLLSEKYNSDTKLASKITFISTFFSIITVPGLVWLLYKLF